MDFPRTTRLSGPVGGTLAVALAASLAGLAIGCGPDPALRPELPSGSLILGSRESFSRVLARMTRLEGTRLAERSRAALAALPDCDTLEGRAANGNLFDAVAELRCSDRGAPPTLAALDRQRGDRDLAFALPAHGPGTRVTGTLNAPTSGNLDIILQLPGDAIDDRVRMLLPGAESPGPTLLRDSGSVFHARLRPDGGLNIADLIDSGGQGDRLFRLKSALFAGAVLDGTWEIAVYPASAGARMPETAVALGFSQRGAAVAALEEFIATLESTWPIRRSDFVIDGAKGACLLDLKLLPDLAPCYVATNTALVVGWNPVSLRRALGPSRTTTSRTSPPTSSLTERGGWVLDFERVAEIDARLSTGIEPGVEAHPRSYPWKRLRAEGGPQVGGVQLQLRFETNPGFQTEPRLDVEPNA